MFPPAHSLVAWTRVPFMFPPVSTRRFHSLHDFTYAGMLLGVRCRRCKHQAQFSASELAAWLRGKTAVEYVSLRMVCRECGHRGADLFPVETDAPRTIRRPDPAPIKPRR